MDEYFDFTMNKKKEVQSLDTQTKDNDLNTSVMRQNVQREL